MEENADVLSQYVPDIHRQLEAIDSRLADQFENVDGITFTLRLIHGLVATMQQQWNSAIASLNIAAWICAIAMVAHVVRHW